MANIFDENLNLVKVNNANKTRVAEPGFAVGKRKRGTEFVVDQAARSDCRYKRWNGILNSMLLLKLCTGVDVTVDF